MAVSLPRIDFLEGCAIEKQILYAHVEITG